MKKTTTKRPERLTVEARGKVIWKGLYEGKKTMTQALNYVESLGLLAVEYCKQANGNRIIVAMTEDEI